MKDKQLIEEIANERIAMLQKLAAKSITTNPDLSKRYLKIAAEIRTHYKIKKNSKSEICKGCHGLLIPGMTCTITVASSKRQLIYKCRNCKYENKIHY